MDTYNKAHSKWPATGEVLGNNKDNLGSSGLLWLVALRFGHRRQGEPDSALMRRAKRHKRRFLWRRFLWRRC
jgi:hypothetical protein